MDETTVAERLNAASEIIKELDEVFEVGTKYEYKDVEDHIRLFKQGNREAGEWIIKAFHPLITKYVRFIHFGFIPYIPDEEHGGTKVEPSVMSFIRMFERKEDRKLWPSLTERFSNVVLRINTLFSSYEYCDIYNELVLALLSMVGRYKILNKDDKYYTENGTFPRYIKKCFHWEVYNTLKKLIKDPLAHTPYLHLIETSNCAEAEYSEEEMSMDDICYINGRAEEEFEKAMNRADTSLRLQLTDKTALIETNNDPSDDSFLDFNWTNGITCSEVFSCLSNVEREVLVLYYCKQQTLDNIGASMRTSRTTICLIRKRAIAKLTMKMAELGIE